MPNDRHSRRILPSPGKYVEIEYSRMLNIFIFVTYVAGQDLSVPAVASVMSHFVAHMLSEAKSIGQNTDLQQKLLDACQEVA